MSLDAIYADAPITENRQHNVGGHEEQDLLFLLAHLILCYTKTMKKIALIVIIIFSIMLSGCLNFGNDVETTSPAPDQVSRCFSEMYLNPDLELRPLGYKLVESGIDDAIWFKFETKADISEIFDATVVDVNQFTQNSTYIKTYEMKNDSWWDVEEKSLFGGQVELPNARYMNIGIEEKSISNTVYIMWHET